MREPVMEIYEFRNEENPIVRFEVASLRRWR